MRFSMENPILDSGRISRKDLEALDFKVNY